MSTRTKDGRLSDREHLWGMYQNATELLRETLPDGSEVRVFNQVMGNGANRAFFLLAFAGTAGRPAAHFSYRTADDALAGATRFLEGRGAHAGRMASSRRQRAAWHTKLAVGTVLVHSWGYDQTNTDYYQVVELSPTGKTCVIRKIAARSLETGWMVGDCWPLANEFIGAPMTKRIGEGDAVKIYDWGSWARPWTPKADHWTAYH